jgi:hypothetical protein
MKYISTMKKQLFTLTLLIGGFASAQSMDQTNEPSLGENLTMYTCDSTTPNLAAITGASVIWDYSQLVGLNGQTKVIELVDPATTPAAASFTTSTKAFNIQGSLTNYFTSTASERTGQGFVFEEQSFGTVLAVFDTDPQTTVSYPFALNSTLSDNFSGQLTFEFNGIPQNPTCTGVTHSAIDGSGELKLPNGINLPNVIRYTTVDTVYTQVDLGIIPLDVEILRSQFEYYDYANGNLPVFIYTTIIIQQAGATTPLLRQSVILSSVQPTSNASISENEESLFKVYPNPTSDALNILGNTNEIETAWIHDASGRLICQWTKDFSLPLDVSSLENGNYFLTMKTLSGLEKSLFTVR